MSITFPPYLKTLPHYLRVNTEKQNIKGVNTQMNHQINELANRLSDFLMQPIRFQNYEIQILNLSVIKHKYFKSIVSDAHPFFEFNYVLDGQFYTTINYKEFFVDTGYSFLVPPRCQHSHRNFKNMEYTDFYIAFTINSVGSDICNDMFSPLFIPYSNTFDSKLNEIHLSEDMYINQLSFIHWLISLSTQLATIYKIKSPYTPTHISDRVIHYMNENYNKKLNVHELADKMNMSYGHLSRLFRTETGTTIVSEFKSIRMDHAKKLLLTTDLSISEIARICGYKNEQYFHRVFKEIVHMTPLNFRNKTIYNI